MNYKDESIVRLAIENWIGLSLGAIHYYGTLYGVDKQIKLQHLATKKQAIKTNKHIREYYAKDYWRLYYIKVGDTVDGFDSKKEVIEEAKLQWKIKFPKAKILIDYNDHNIIYDEKK